MRFALTGYKVQGQNCKKLILQLNERPFVPKITFNSLLVSLSRVQRGNDISIMPIHSGSHGLHYLTELRPDDAFIDWNDGFEEDLGSGAVWNIEKARQMYAIRHPKEELTTSKQNGEKTVLYSNEFCFYNFFLPDCDEMPNDEKGKTTKTYVLPSFIHSLWHNKNLKTVSFLFLYYSKFLTVTLYSGCETCLYI